MSPTEVKELAADIKKNGLFDLPKVWREDDDSPWQLLDGRNRLDAMEIACGPGTANIANTRTVDSSVDPYDYVISANIKRRHLTAKQKRELIAKLLKAQPEKSNRQIAEAVKVHHGTVGAVRDEMEGRGEISHVATHTDTKGRDQPANKGDAAKKAAAKKAAAKKAAEEKARAAAKAEAKAAAEAAAEAAAHADISANGAGEAARSARVHALAEEIKSITALVTALDSDVRDFLRDLVARVTGMAAEQRAGLLRRLRQALDDPAPDDNGLDIPASQRRH
jgi:hypothetical protein